MSDADLVAGASQEAPAAGAADEPDATGDQLEGGAYELLHTRLVDHANELTRRATALNGARIETFGSSRFEVVGVERIRTENNSIARDMVAAGGDLLFAYNVFIGLKAETTIDDVLSLHHYRSSGDGMSLDPAPDGSASNWLHDERFATDFRELYTYYKDARLLRLQRREGRLLAVFQTGQSLDDVRVFRWSVSADEEVSYLDNRGERDYEPVPQFDFVWSPITREHHVTPAVGDGTRRAHVNVVDRVFVDPSDGTLDLRLENNTPDGELVLSEPVIDSDQSIADAAISFAVLGDIVVLRVRPYQEPDERGYIVNTFTRRAQRCDAILTSCLQLPEDHGVIHPGGYELRTGESKRFDVDTSGMAFEMIQRSPNGEDVLFVFHEPVAGLSTMMPYNVIRREVGQPITAHGWSLFEDGTLVVFRADDEPTRVHQMQLWATPFVSDEFAARQPVGDSLLHRVGNADLVRGVSDSMNIAKQVREAEPSAAVFADLATSAARVLDGHYWISEQEIGDLSEPLAGIQATAGSIIDEFEKVQLMKASAAESLRGAADDVESLRRELLDNQPSTATEWVDALRRVRNQRGHLIGLGEVRHIDSDELGALDEQLGAQFDVLSDQAATFFASPAAFDDITSSLTALENEVGEASGTAVIADQIDRLDELGSGLEVLAQVATELQIDDPSVRTAVLERLSEVMAHHNRVTAVGANRRRDLARSEGGAAFSVEMTLFSQSATSELARIATPDDADEALGRLLLMLEELESRFAEFDDELEQIGHKREEIYEVVSTRRQSLVDDRQRRAQRLSEAAERILTGIAHRVDRFESTDEMHAWFLADPMVARVRSLAEQLRDLEQAVAADELVRRLETARDDAGRSLRDRADIIEDGGRVIRLGSHRFSVDRHDLELTTGVFDEVLHAVLVGTDFRVPLDDARLAGTERFWHRGLVSESDGISRAEYLAATMLLDALGSADSLDALVAARNAGELGVKVRRTAEERLDEGYERGVHDHDASAILEVLVDIVPTAGLLRFSPLVRADAQFAWAAINDDLRSEWSTRAMSLGRLRGHYPDTPAIDDAVTELGSVVAAVHESAEDPLTSAAYLFEELTNDVVGFVSSTRARDLVEALRRHVESGDRLAGELAALNGDRDAQRELADAWFGAFVEAADPTAAPWIPEAVALVVTDLNRTPATGATTGSVEGLLSAHPRITEGRLEVAVDQLLTAAMRHARDEVPSHREFLEVRSAVLADIRADLRLEEFQPKVMSAFVRNRLIDSVYLPLIGDNLAKQVGSLDSARTDQMGLLLLISPPGYGKTTLMEYVANRLGMVFVKVNGPALGTGVTSLDPADAPDATAAQEVDKINFALEMGSNVLLYLDDIQHTNPELLQKFISMTDAQRRMEGVWQGQTRTYDLRGKRFAVVMAGNPYTESGERFAIPDMLANRADTWNLGDVLSGQEDVFALSYIENALASNDVLQPLTRFDLADVATLISMVSGTGASSEDLRHGWSAAELDEIMAVLSRLLRVQEVLLAVNQTYISSAATAEEFRTEPRFQLQGSYRNMARLAEKVLPVMNDAELEALIDDHYRGEAQTLTSGTEANLLKLGELRGTLSGEEAARWDEIRSVFARNQRTGGAEADPMAAVAASLADIGDTLRGR